MTQLAIESVTHLFLFQGVYGTDRVHNELDLPGETEYVFV